MKRLIIFIICLCLLLSACARSEAEQGSVTIWYISGDPLEPLLREKCAASLSDNEPGLEIVLRPFESMAVLSEELQGRRPDLLLCSYEAASTLQEQDMLKTLSLDGLEYRSDYTAAYPGFGTGFFPVGASVELLCGTRACEAENLEAFVEMLCTEGESMTADSFARLISSALMQRGASLSASRLENAADEDYVYLHNLLAEAAYEGSVGAFDEGAAELLRQERVDWAVVNSAALQSAEPDWSISPMPAAEGGKKIYMADMRGFAYLGNTFDNSKNTARVLSELLCNGRGRELALSAGLIPAQSWDGNGADSALGQALYELYSGWELVLPSPVSGYVKGRQALEEEFRTVVSLLQ